MELKLDKSSFANAIMVKIEFMAWPNLSPRLVPFPMKLHKTLIALSIRY